MSKGNKDIILAILKYLNDSMDEEKIDFSKVNEKSLDVSYPRYCRVLTMMVDEGLISGLAPITFMESTYTEYKPVSPIITLKGIDYLEENKLTKRAYAFLKEKREWVPGM
ncbi:YjcQ family protein [Oceanobacillus aidingensis]|uniref:YjcQ family protein n=1 Tax=Oceanobacillus aidingensis TaxID=645964 RepID=A0ABV9JVD6_9BACI